MFAGLPFAVLCSNPERLGMSEFCLGHSPKPSLGMHKLCLLRKLAFTFPIGRQIRAIPGCRRRRGLASLWRLSKFPPHALAVLKLQAFVCRFNKKTSSGQFICIDLARQQHQPTLFANEAHSRHSIIAMSHSAHSGSTVSTECQISMLWYEPKTGSKKVKLICPCPPGTGTRSMPVSITIRELQKCNSQLYALQVF